MTEDLFDYHSIANDAYFIDEEYESDSIQSASVREYESYYHNIASEIIDD